MTGDLGREQWGSRAGFLLAAAGSAIGLGNIWRFTYIMGNNGGAAFILIYLVCIVLVGAPIFLAELTIGRRAGLNPVGAFRMLMPGTCWPWIGGMGVVAGFLILSFYSVVGGWVAAYLLDSVRGTINSLATPDAAASHFGTLQQSTVRSIGFHGLFMLFTAAIVARGIKGGIERASKIMMPILFVLMLVLIVRGLFLPGAGAGVRFLLRPDLSQISPGVLLTAMGHAFFTLSVGMGMMITYGSYLRHEHDLPRASAEVAGMDTLVALAAGFVIFPAVFAFGMEPEQGPGLLFVTLPGVFQQMPGGGFFATLFFLLVLMAAITSSISMLEIVTAYFIDERRWRRARAAWSLGGLIFIVGVPSAIAFGIGSDWSIASMLGAAAGEGLVGNFGLFRLNWFDLISHIVSDYMLPVGGFFIATFVAWIWDRDAVAAEVHQGSAKFVLFDVWIGLLRWVGPLVILQVLFLGILAEFPAQYFPGVAVIVEQLQYWFGWIDLVVAIGVVVTTWRCSGAGAKA